MCMFLTDRHRRQASFLHVPISQVTLLLQCQDCSANGQTVWFAPQACAWRSPSLRDAACGIRVHWGVLLDKDRQWLTPARAPMSRMADIDGPRVRCEGGYFL